MSNPPNQSLHKYKTKHTYTNIKQKNSEELVSAVQPLFKKLMRRGHSGIG